MAQYALTTYASELRFRSRWIVWLTIHQSWANVTEGDTCVVENTPYIAYTLDGNEFVDIVSRYMANFHGPNPY
jgi:hypothetical protein